MVWTKTRLRDMVRQRLGDELFVIVSNREPYIHVYEGEEIVCQVPPGGLTSAMDPVMRACGGLWVAHGSGDADRQMVDASDRIMVPPDNPSYTLRRIWLTKQEEDGYYNGFSNEALWPLCHIAYTKPMFIEEDWKAYQTVNRKFAKAILEEIGDRKAFVFIQDYHLALLSNLLRRPNIRTAQFWHIPWPNPEAFRVCPWGEQILEGLLGNDLLGFHIQHHCQNFLDTVEQMLGTKYAIDRDQSTVTRGELTTMVQPFPISVDFETISAQAASTAVEAEMARLQRQFGLRDRVIGLGVDRIDYTKGIPEQLIAIDKFLERHPEFIKRFMFVEIGVPSRGNLEVYQRLNDEIDRLVKSINWKYQTDNWKPILFLKRHASPLTLQAWYRLADLCVISSLHDGMNLVAKEFVASRIHDDGVLVLSRFTGAARELTEAELINPYAVDDVAEAFYRAATMSPDEQRRRMRILKAQVSGQNIFTWASTILTTLFRFEFQKV